MSNRATDEFLDYLYDSHESDAERWEKYDGWSEPPDEEDADEGYDRMRQNEVDDSLFGLAADISRLQGLTMCKRQA